MLDSLSVDNQLKINNLFIEYCAPNYFLKPNLIIYDRSRLPLFCAAEKSKLLIRDLSRNSFVAAKTDVYTYKQANPYMNFWVDRIYLHDDVGCGNRSPNFESLNFKWDKNHWQQIKLNNLLNINEINKPIFIQLFSEKLSALKNVEIDCSNPSKYVEMVQNQFYVSDDGIQFRVPYGYRYGTLSIFFSWAELKPFLF